MKPFLIYLSLTLLFSQISCKPVEAPEQTEPNEDSKVAIHKGIEAYLINIGIDPNPIQDGYIDKKLMQNVDTLRIMLDSESNGSLKGLKYFSNLKYLTFSSNVFKVYSSHDGKDIYPNFKIPLDTLDISGNGALEHIECAGLSSGGGISPLIGHLIVGENNNLKTLICDNNLMRQLDLSGAVNIETLTLSNSLYITSISLCHNKQLTRFIGQLMQVSIASAKQMEQFRLQSPNARFMLCQ